MMAGLRVVLDTNVLVSGLAYPASVPGRILGAWQQGGLDVVLSKYILDEMVRVLPHLKRITLSRAEIRDLADSFLFMAEIVEPSGEVDEALRDKADGPVLGTLLASNADYLVTGDKDLLALTGRYPIVTPAVFWERHRSSPNLVLSRLPRRYRTTCRVGAAGRFVGCDLRVSSASGPHAAACFRWSRRRG